MKLRPDHLDIHAGEAIAYDLDRINELLAHGHQLQAREEIWKLINIGKQAAYEYDQGMSRQHVATHKMEGLKP